MQIINNFDFWWEHRISYLKDTITDWLGSHITLGKIIVMAIVVFLAVSLVMKERRR